MRNQRLTICQLLLTLGVGGAEVLAARLARKLADRHQFVFVCLDELGPIGEQLTQDGFPVHVIGRRNGVDVQCAHRLARYLQQVRADLIHCHQYGPFFYGSLSGLFWRRPPIVFTEHGRLQPDYPRRKRILANRFLLRRRDRVVGVGRAVCQALIANEGIPEQRVELVYNGVDVNQFQSNEQARKAVRNQLQLSSDDFAIIQVARLDAIKDHATALRALAQVSKQRTDIKLLVVGNGPELSKIERLIREYELTNVVRLLGWRHDIADLCAASDLVLLTSIAEGIPLTLIEAMAVGLPVLSTDAGGVSEVVEAGKTGFVVPAGDDRSLAEKMQILADNPALRRQMGERGKQRAADLFCESRMVDQYCHIYEQLGCVCNGQEEPVLQTAV